jgi:hypothetical protein
MLNTPRPRPVPTFSCKNCQRNDYELNLQRNDLYPNKYRTHWLPIVNVPKFSTNQKPIWAGGSHNERLYNRAYTGISIFDKTKPLIWFYTERTYFLRLEPRSCYFSTNRDHKFYCSALYQAHNRCWTHSIYPCMPWFSTYLYIHEISEK